MTTRYLGTCPVCGGEQKLHRDRMVHHGYRRPGYGQIVGDCFGVGYPPYELSPEGTRAYLVEVERALRDNFRALRALQERPPLDRHVNWMSRYEAPQYEHLTVADGARYERELEQRIQKTQHAIEELEREASRCEQLIANWQPRPVRTIEEVAQLERQAKEARAAERQTLKESRDAKRAASLARGDARAARERAFIERYREAFLIPDLTGTRATALWIKMHREAKREISSSGRFMNKFVAQMGIDDRLIQLDLAAPGKHSRHALYADPNGVLYD